MKFYMICALTELIRSSVLIPARDFIAPPPSPSTTVERRVAEQIFVPMLLHNRVVLNSRHKPFECILNLFLSISTCIVLVFCFINDIIRSSLLPFPSIFFDLLSLNYILLCLYYKYYVNLQGSYLEGISKGIGGLTQKVKSWYWGRPLVSLDCLLYV